MSAFKDPATRGLVVDCHNITRGQAWTWLRGAIESDLETARNLPVCDSCVKWYAQPATTQWVALGVWPKSEYVTIKGVASAMAANELRTVAGSESIPLPTGIPTNAAPTKTRTVRGRTLSVGDVVGLPNRCNFRKSSDTSTTPHFMADPSDLTQLEVLDFSENNWVKVKDLSSGTVGWFGPVCWR